MPTIIAKDQLAPSAYRLEVDAPLVAERRKPGQFVVVRANEWAERLPLTIVDGDTVAGTITLIFQVLGEGTRLLSTLDIGDEIRDIVGPLGRPTEIAYYGSALCIGGGIGVAPLFPIVKGLVGLSNRVTTIIGARSKELLILEDDLRGISSELLVTTDDGSYGRRGFVTDALRELLESGMKPGVVVAIGPLPMMRSVSEVTRPYGLKTIVSLNPIMVDGTGMCGGCRVTIGGELRFACVDGPEFDGHQVNFAELANRQRMYREQEQCKIRSLI